MGRPKGATNQGLQYVVSRAGRELEMTSKKADINVEELSSVATAYRRLLGKAMRCASPDDAVTLQRIGTGLTALTKAVSTVERMKKDADQGLAKSIVYPID